MMAVARELDGASSTDIDDDVASTVREIEEDDVVVVNEDRRTWLVTDTVEMSLTDDETPREQKVAVRLQTRRGMGPESASAALVLVSYPDHEEAAIHILDGKNRGEDNAVYAVEHVEVLDPDPSWVVVQRAGHSNVYHLPAPVPAAGGEALPACGGQPGEVEPSEYRVVGRIAVPNLEVCRDCARRQRPRELETVICPECGRNIASGLLQGPRVEGVTGLHVECPESDCSFSGTVGLPRGLAGGIDALGGGA